MIVFAVASLAGCGSKPQRGTSITLHLFDRNGDPELIGSDETENGRGTLVGWRACPPNGDCGEVVQASDVFEPGTTAPGTRFELVVKHREIEYRTRSRTWQGRLRVVRPPRLEGPVSIGATVRVSPGRWRGGWQDHSFSEYRIEACRTSRGDGCETLAASEEGGGGTASARISRYYAGWYVQAAEARYSYDDMSSGPDYGDGPAMPTLERGADVAVSPPLRVPGSPIQAPAVALRDRVNLVDGRALVGQVRCTRCEVELVAHTRHWRTRQRVQANGTTPLVLERGGRRGAWVRVSLDGRVLEERPVGRPRSGRAEGRTVTGSE